MVNTSITETYPVDFNKQIKPFTIIDKKTGCTGHLKVDLPLCT